MTTLNNLLKAAARKHALQNKIVTSSWTDQDFLEYIGRHGITERDNLKKAETKTEAKQEVKVGKKADGTTGVVKQEVKPAGKVEAAIAELIAATGGTATLDEERVIELIGQYSKAPTTHNITLTKDDEVIVTREGVHKDYKLVMEVIAAGVNIAAVGPAGSGKSTMFKQIAEDLGLDYYTMSQPQQEHKVLGYMDANGGYHSTPFRDAFEKGGLVVVEEFDGSNPKALLACNNATANDTCDFPDGMVTRHPDFVCVMAGNTYGTGASRQYVGRSQIDAATLDRFAFIEIGYDEGIERQAALSFNPEAGVWVDTVQSFRSRVEAAGIKHIVSPRASINGAKLLKRGLPVDVVTKIVLHKGMSQDQISQIGG
jgi:hypothetical protein